MIGKQKVIRDCCSRCLAVKYRSARIYGYTQQEEDAVVRDWKTLKRCEQDVQMLRIERSYIIDPPARWLHEQYVPFWHKPNA